MSESIQFGLLCGAGLCVFLFIGETLLRFMDD
jgi:hypothetical protein